MAYQQHSGVFTNTQAAQAKGQEKWVSSVVQEAGDPDFASTTLLLQGNGSDGGNNNGFIDSSSNAHTITRNGNVTQGSFSPFSVDEGKWGNYFDGSGDYLTAGTTASDFLCTGSTTGITATFEAWVFPTAYSTGATDWRFSSVHAKGETYLNFGVINGAVRFYWFDGSPNFVDSASTSDAPLNSWTHIAVTISESTIKIYINGTLNTTSATYTGVSTDGLGGTEFIGRENSGPIYFSGYISNHRLTDSIVYTSDFTVPTEPLTAISGTSLLTCQSNRFVDNSSNAHSITVNGTPKVVPFFPFPQTTAYDASTNGGSGYFDGSLDYLTVAKENTNSFAIASSEDFTIEMWVNLNNALARQCFTSWWGTSDDDRFRFEVNKASGNIYFVIGNTEIFGAHTLSSTAWHHVAAVRNSDTFSIYIDGVSVLSQTLTGAINRVNADPFVVGSLTAESSPVSSDFVDGYISNFRFIKGEALYTSAFTPPTAPPTDVSNTSLLLNFANASIVDATGKNVLETVGNAQVDTTTVKYGTGAMEFDGTGDYLEVPDNPAFVFGTGDFTIEAWAYTTDNTRSVGGVSQRIFDIDSGSVGIWIQSSTGNISYNAGNVTASTTVFPENQWNHVALSRSGSSLKLFLNGVEVSSATNTNSLGSSGEVTVGAYGQSSDGAFLGYIDDLRITKGIARYTANFTPPTAEFRADGAEEVTV